MKKKADIAITKLIIILLAIFFLFVAVGIIFAMKGKGFSVIDEIRNLFIFGP